MRLLEVIDTKDYDPSMPRLVRHAVRAVIFRGDQVAMIKSKYGDYKFPGGGMEQGESHADTLVREVKEETGLCVIPSSCFPFGEMLERRKDKYTEQIFEHHSYYYFCDITDDAGVPHLEGYEVAYSYRLVWVTLQDSLCANMCIPEDTRAPWTIRDTRVMKQLMELFPQACACASG